jgi:hypothetical protein
MVKDIGSSELLKQSTPPKGGHRKKTGGGLLLTGISSLALQVRHLSVCRGHYNGHQHQSRNAEEYTTHVLSSRTETLPIWKAAGHSNWQWGREGPEHANLVPL